MTRDEAITLMQQQLGFRGDQASNLVLYLKLAQQQLELEPGKPWFLVSENLTTSTTPSEARVGVPSSMITEYDDAALFWVPSVGDNAGKELELKKDEYDILVRNYRDSSPSQPKAYALRGDYFVIFPTPDASYQLLINIFKHDVVLDSNVENQWLKECPLLIMGKALQLIATAVRDQVAANTSKDWERQGRLALIAQIEDRDLSNQELQMGGPH